MKEYIVTTEQGANQQFHELIRCKDCKWYYRGGATCMYWDGANSMFGDDFCSRAERRDHDSD